MVTAALVALVVIAAAPTASAQTEVVNGQQFRDWTLACRATAINKTSCVIKQLLVEAGANRFLAEVALSITADEEADTVLVVRLPTEVLLLRQAVMRIDDDAEPIPLRWQSCDKVLCTATVILDEETEEKLRRGLKATFGYQRLEESEPTVFDISLLGVTRGLNTLIKATSGGADDDS
jgi:invasion protein IalB